MLYYKTYQNPQHQEWVTFLHGAGGSSTIWFNQIKDFRAQYNVLLVDLRGHGRSKNHFLGRDIPKYTFKEIATDVIEVMDHLAIEKSHFVGISLGTILIREMAECYPERVHKIILGGAILKMNLRGQILMRFGNLFKSLVPYLILYKFFAWIILPRRNHRRSRLLFIKEARKLYQKEFIRWFKLVSEINPLLRLHREKDATHPTLYLMGEQDHMFLPTIEKLVRRGRSGELRVLEGSGHVVNIDKPREFNRLSLAFLGGSLPA